MKHHLLLLLCSMIFCTAIAQSDSALKSRIDSLSMRMDDKYYTRVPNNDFEKILNLKVKDEIEQQGKYWLAIIFGLSTLVGFLAKFYFTKNTREQVVENVKEQLTPIISKVDLLIEEQKTFIAKINVAVDEKIENTLSFIWDDIADSMIERAKAKKFIGKDLIKSIKGFLDSTLKLSPDRKIMMIDTLMRCYYTYTKDNEIKGFEKMINLVKQYESDNDLLATTYMNAAIALCNYYEYYGSENYHRDCIENCNKAIGKSPDYGTAYMVILEVYIIDYQKAGEDMLRRNEALENVRRTSQSIKNNKSESLCMEVFERFEQDKPVPYLKKHLEEFEQLFPDDLNKIRERTVGYLLKNLDATSQSEKDFAQLNKLLTEGMRSSIDIDGSWIPVSAKVGGESQPVDKIPSLILDGFKLTYGSSQDVGYIYFVSKKEPFNMIIYYLQENPLKAIYKEANNVLTICYKTESEDYPQDFSSTLDNGYSLVEYNKAISNV